MGRFLKLYWLIKHYSLFSALRLFFQLGRRPYLRVPGVKHHIHLRKKTSDIPAFEQVFITQEYDFDPGCDPSIIIDAGANIGLGSAYFANRYPAARILAIEPEPENYQMLKKNAALYENVTPIKAALWFEDTELNIFDQGQGEWAYTVGEENLGGIGKTMALSIPHLMAAYDLPYIDILKVDIEGSEKELFTSNYEEWLPKVRVLVIELHDHYKQGTSRQFFETISKYQFSFHATEDRLLLRNENFATPTSTQVH